MFNPERDFFDVKSKLPEDRQRVLAYNGKLDEFINAVFKDGKFYENDNELVNITKWADIKNNIVF